MTATAEDYKSAHCRLAATVAERFRAPAPDLRHMRGNRAATRR